MSRTAALGDIITLKRGYDLPSSRRQPGAYPIVSSSGISDYHIEPKVKGPGVVTGRYGTLGKTFYIPGDYWPLNTTLYVQDFKDNNPKYINYLLSTLKLGSENIAGAVPGVNRNFLHKISVPFVSREQQDKLVEIIDTIDEKIELNRRMNETLEQIAQALFGHYFINNTEAEDWQESDISVLSDNVRSSARPPFSADLQYVALEHITRSTLALYDSSRASVATSNKTAFQKGDVLFGKLRPYFHKVAIAPFDGICSTDILAIRPKKKEYFSYVALFLSQKSLIDYVTQGSGGTRMPRTSWSNICKYRLFLPPNDLLVGFDRAAEPMLQRIIDNTGETQTLGTIRDLLLPRLISGKIKV